MKIYEASLSYRLIGEASEAALDRPDCVVRYMDGAFDEDPTVEWFFVIPLNRKNRPISRVSVSKGTACSALVHPREVFKPVILAGATALIVCHNHPSGDCQPSRADIQITRQLRDAAKLMNISLLDHIIIGDSTDHPPGWYSFSESGML